MPASKIQPPGSDPLVIVATRGNFIESRHRVACAVLDADGEVVARWGDIDIAVSPRSACKPLQQIPLVETGATDAFAVSAEELALACSSHSAQPEHVRLVATWLARIGLGEVDLECGSHDPMHEPTTRAMWQRGEAPSQLHNNCSGKHTGFLTLARHLGVATKGYVGRDHAIQRLIARTMGEMTGSDLASAPCGLDGCGIPTFAFPLRGLALGLARMSAPDNLDPVRAAACRRLLDGMGSHPLLVAGDGRFDTEVMRATGRRLVCKGGAEGVHVVAIRTRGWGLALKALDGAARAADAAAAAVLEYLGVLEGSDIEAVGRFLRQPIVTRASLAAGWVQPEGLSF